MGHKKSKHPSVPALEQAVLRRITAATSFLPDEIQYFYYDFIRYTPKGYLTLGDFERFYKTLFFAGAPEAFAAYAFRAYDTNHDGIVDFEEFISALYYTTKASATEKIRWAFDLCDRDNDHQLDVSELESVILAIYELSDPDMARFETYEEAMQRIKTLFLSNGEESDNEELLDSVTKGEFVNIVQKDQTIMKLIDCRPIVRKRSSKGEGSGPNPSRKQLKFKRPIYKSLSDSTLTRIDDD